jgi:hypothetical protein
VVEFLKAWGTLIVAVLALIQPWVVGVWRRFFRQGTIDIHETGTVEVGYSQFGPTIGLYGTLRAIFRDQFVRSMELMVTKQKDSSKHSFEWGVFRAQRFTLGGAQEGSFELPSGFLLTTTQPRRYNIQFFDVATQAEITPHVVTVVRGWAEVSGKFDLGTGPAQMQAAIQQALANLHVEFSRSEGYVSAYAAIDRLCYWEAGRYSLEMRVNTARPDRTFQRRWFFELSENEVHSIRLNTVKLLQDLCGRVYGQYNFAYAKYHRHE